MEKVFPAIRANFTFQMYVSDFKQLDNAGLHIKPNNPSIIQAELSSSSSWLLNRQIECQPPESPYLNALYFMFSRCNPSLQSMTTTRSIKEMVTSMKYAFQNYLREKLQMCFWHFNHSMQVICMFINRGSSFNTHHGRS